jgi:hypothetical protein
VLVRNPTLTAELALLTAASTWLISRNGFIGSE